MPGYRPGMSENPAAPGLVEPEGVNAGSAAATDESPATPPHGDALRSDGSPTDPEDGDVAGLVADEAADDDPDAAAQGIAESLAGAPGTSPQDPGQYAAESGQDGGSMS